MKKTFLIIWILIFNNSFLNAQPVFNWQRTLGGTDQEQLWTSSPTNDLGFILGGFSGSTISGNKTDSCRGGNDYWIIKLDSSGNIQWDRTYGGSMDDNCFSVHQTHDQGYIVGGSSESDSTGDKNSHSRGDMDFWILKLDIQGNIQWQKTIGGIDLDFFKSIIQTIDGGFIVCGTSTSNISGEKSEARIGDEDYWILKLDSLGNIEWQNTIGGFNSDYIAQTIPLNDGGYAIAGTSISGISADKTESAHLSSPDFWILKIDNNGNILWQHTLGGNDNDEAMTIHETLDHGLLIGGISFSNSSFEKTENNRGLADYWIIKLDSTGSLQWEKTLGGSAHDNLYSIVQLDNGKLLIGGESKSNISGDKTEDSHGFSDFWLVGLSPAGNYEWQKTIGGDGDDLLNEISKGTNGKIVLAGSSLSSISGDKTEPQIGFSDYWIISSSILSNIIDFEAQDFINIFPNPTHNILYLENHSKLDFQFSIFDLNGKQINITSSNIAPNQINVSNIQNGVYILKAITSNIIFTKKFTVINY